jgi:hypothetical protein
MNNFSTVHAIFARFCLIGDARYGVVWIPGRLSIILPVPHLVPCGARSFAGRKPPSVRLFVLVHNNFQASLSYCSGNDIKNDNFQYLKWVSGRGINMKIKSSISENRLLDNRNSNSGYQKLDFLLSKMINHDIGNFIWIPDIWNWNYGYSKCLIFYIGLEL